MKKGILIDVQNRTITEVEIGDGIQPIYELVKCDTFTCVDITETETVYVDDNGLLTLTENSMFFELKGYPQPLCGNGLILGVDEEGESVNTKLTIDEVKKLVKFKSIHEVWSHFV